MQQRPMSEPSDLLAIPGVVKLVRLFLEHFGEQRQEVLLLGGARTGQLREGRIALLEATAAVREGNWKVDPVPAELLERRVELIGGCSSREIVEGLNSGAKSYVADLWGMTAAGPAPAPWAYQHLVLAATRQLGYTGTDGELVRINPGSTTRLMIALRPLLVEDHAFLGTEATVPGCFVDLAMVGWHCGRALTERQGGIFLYLRGIRSHQEARLWNGLFDLTEKQLGLPAGTIRATVVVDSLCAALDADEILHELRHHSAGTALAPQAYTADHIALFSTPDRAALPDRRHIGLNARFLRSVSLRTIGISHRRGAHAMGAPAFVLPPVSKDGIDPDYLEMIADKEREAVDGHDGTLVAHPGLVNAAMAEFNKSMPMAHQMDYRPAGPASLEDLALWPEGELTTAGIQNCIRTVIKVMVGLQAGQGMVVQGGRLHDRSSVRLATLLLWHWAQSKRCFITATGLEIHNEMMKYLIRKEAEKIYAQAGAELQERARQAGLWLTDVVLCPEVPSDELEVRILPAVKE